MSSVSLLRALDQQDVQETSRILQTMPSEVSMKDEEDRVALHYAAETMDLEMFEKIFEQDKTLIDCQDRAGHTPLLMATMGGRTDIVEFLLARGANINQVDRDGHSVVHWAVVCGQLETLSLLISKGADVNTKDLLMATPLHYATATEDVPHEVSLSILHTVLRAGGEVNGRDIDERTPILWSASNGNGEAMASLKQAGGDIQAVDRDRLGVLHCCASHGYHEIIDFFLESSPRTLVDQKDRSGHTALFYAVTYGHYEAARKLLSYGSNANHQDYRLRTASHCAAAKGQLRMLKLLRQYGASFEIQNYRGDLPVHEAVQAGSKDLVEWLLALQPSSLNAANHEGRTGLHLAAATGNIEMVVMLCTMQCFVNPLMLYKDKLYTPLDLAKRKDHQVVVEYLTMRCGAKLVEEIDDETKMKSKVTFEEQIVQGKLARGRHLEREESVTDMESKRRRRRRSSDMGEMRQRADTAVNTTFRRVSSVASGLLGKSTSTTELNEMDDNELREMIRKELEARRREKGEENKDVNVEKTGDQTNSSPQNKENPNSEATQKEVGILDEFEDLPGISDSSEEGEVEIQNENSKPLASSLKKRKEKENAETSQDKTMKKKGSRVISGKKLTKKTSSKTSKSGKSVRIEGKNGEGSVGVLMTVKRDAEKGEEGDEVDIFEDDWEHLQQHERVTGKDAARKYVHEKAIFQELTHLKRMQIQYGKVQEKVLVRSLVANFCKMHGLDPAKFKFQTFYAWEKFLYEQLKTIYLEERERLSRANVRDKFETRLRQARAIPLNDKVSRMSQVYSSSTMTSGANAVRNRPSGVVCAQGGKRCDCLGKHLLIKQK